MGTSINDIYSDMYFEEMHDKYISSLEKFSKSRNLQELKNNLEEIRSLEQEFSDIDSTEARKHLDNELSELKTIGNIYEKLIIDSEKSKRQFYIGTFLAIVGFIPTIVSLLGYLFHRTR